MDNNKRKMMSWLLGAGLSISAAISGAFLVAPHEGKVNGSYVDPVNIITSCYGHTGKNVKLGQEYSDLDCLNQLAGDLGKAQKEVHSVIKVPLTYYQEAALISFTYNVGVTNLRSSTLAKDLNNKQYTEGCKELLKWVYAGKKKLKGLEERRNQEYKMCIGNSEFLNEFNNQNTNLSTLIYFGSSVIFSSLRQNTDESAG